MNKFSAYLFGCVALVPCLPAHAVLIKPGDIVQISADFSGQALEPPYELLTLELFTKSWGETETLLAQVFDGQELRPQTPLSWTGNPQAFSGFFGVTFDFGPLPANSFVRLQSVDASFDLLSVTLQATNIDDSGFQVETDRLIASIEVNAAPVPATAWFLLLGLGVLAHRLLQKDKV